MRKAVVKKDKLYSRGLRGNRQLPKSDPSQAGFKLTVYNTEGKSIDEMAIDKRIFDGKVNKKALYQAIISYQANKRSGCASCKNRGEVSGGGSKPWRQKGTGRSRAGSSRSPIFRHGGVVFGPKPRDFSYSIPKKIKLLALRSSLNAKLKEKDLVLIDDVKLKHLKTKEMARVLSRLSALRDGAPKVASGLKLNYSILGIFELDSQVLRCVRNISNLDVIRPQDINAYDILRYKKLLITKDSLNKIIKRIAK